jgi:hypothetical protein
MHNHDLPDPKRLRRPCDIWLVNVGHGGLGNTLASDDIKAPLSILLILYC